MLKKGLLLKLLRLKLEIDGSKSDLNTRKILEDGINQSRLLRRGKSQPKRYKLKRKMNKNGQSWDQFLKKLTRTVMVIAERKNFRLMNKLSRMRVMLTPKLLSKNWKKLISARSRRSIWTR